MDFSRQVNYKSDFDVLLRVADSEGNAVGFPSFDFVLTFGSSGQRRFEAGQANGFKRGVSDAGGDIRVVFNDHRLLPGALTLEVRADVENDIYPDGKKLYVFDVPTNITLVDGAGEVSTGIVIDVTLPFAVPSGSSSSSDSGSSSDGGGSSE